VHRTKVFHMDLNKAVQPWRRKKLEKMVQQLEHDEDAEVPMSIGRNIYIYIHVYTDLCTYISWRTCSTQIYVHILVGERVLHRSMYMY